MEQRTTDFLGTSSLQQRSAFNLLFPTQLPGILAMLEALFQRCKHILKAKGHNDVPGLEVNFPPSSRKPSSKKKINHRITDYFELGSVIIFRSYYPG